MKCPHCKQRPCAQLIGCSKRRQDLTSEDWAIIRDALEHRVRTCRELVNVLKSGPTGIEKKLAQAFEATCRNADELYDKLERMDLI